jgi:hypothetical protein
MWRSSKHKHSRGRPGESLYRPQATQTY